MVGLRRVAAAIEGFFYAARPMHSLVLARIAFGLVLFLCYANRLPDILLLYGPEGLLGPELATHLDTQDLYGTAPAFELWGDWLRSVLPARSNAGIVAMTAVLMLSALCFALGLFTTASGVVALALHHVFAAFLLPYSYWGWSVHIQPLIVYVLCARTGRFASLDAWRAQRRGAAPAPAGWLGPAWPLRLLQIHTCTMYAVAAWSRIDDPGWLHGEAVFEAVTVALHAKFAINWQPFKLALALGTWISLALESLAPILLWVPRVGPLIAYALIGMHIGLEALSNLGWWSHVMTASLLSFVPNAHLVGALRRLPAPFRTGLVVSDTPAPDAR